MHIVYMNVTVYLVVNSSKSCNCLLEMQSSTQTPYLRTVLRDRMKREGEGWTLACLELVKISV